jgi:hypothetical protein
VIIVYACLLLLLVHTVLPGSDLRRLAGLRLRSTWLVWAALAAQVLIMLVLPQPDPRVAAGVHLGTYALAGLFVLRNLDQGPGTWLMAAGGALNLAAIAANGGTMPASATALTASGWQPTPERFANSAALPDPELALLGDVFATPGWLPVSSVFSVGDVVIVAGVAVLLHLTCRPRGARALLPCGPPTV